MSLRSDIRRCLRQNPALSGMQIAEQLGVKPTPSFWRILNDEQVTIRGIYPGRRKNTNAHNKSRIKGMVRFIPPENEARP
jgi:hypothetical protein